MHMHVHWSLHAFRTLSFRVWCQQCRIKHCQALIGICTAMGRSMGWLHCRSQPYASKVVLVLRLPFHLHPCAFSHTSSVRACHAQPGLLRCYTSATQHACSSPETPDASSTLFGSAPPLCAFYRGPYAGNWLYEISHDVDMLVQVTPARCADCVFCNTRAAHRNIHAEQLREC